MYAYFESSMHERAGAVAHEIPEGGAVMNGTCDMSGDAVAFGEANVEHIQVGTWKEGLYVGEVGVYNVYRRMG